MVVCVAADLRENLHVRKLFTNVTCRCFETLIISRICRYESVPRDCNDAGAYHDLRLAVPVLLKVGG